MGKERTGDEAQCTFETEKFTLLPRHVPQPTRVRRDKDDHRQQHDRGPGLRVLCTRDEDIACMFGHD